MTIGYVGVAKQKGPQYYSMCTFFVIENVYIINYAMPLTFLRQKLYCKHQHFSKKSLLLRDLSF